MGMGYPSPPHAGAGGHQCEKIKAAAGELRAQADASGKRKVRYAESEAFKDGIFGFGFFLTLKLAQNVTTAIHKAEASTKPREKGWLKPS